MSKSVSAKRTEAPDFLAFPEPPCLQSVACFRRPPSLPFPPFSVAVRFGEGVFTEWSRDPQEEKTRILWKSARVPISPNVCRGFRSPMTLRHPLPCGRPRPTCAAKPMESRDSHPHAASASWVIRPPQTVSAIPSRSISSGATASISPPRSTRSPASPGTSRPVTFSRCAAQAPPAV